MAEEFARLVVLLVVGAPSLLRECVRELALDNGKGKAGRVDLAFLQQLVLAINFHSATTSAYGIGQQRAAGAGRFCFRRDFLARSWLFL